MYRFSVVTYFAGQIQIADLVELIEERDHGRDECETSADQEHACEAERLLASLYQKGSQHGRNSEGREHIAVDWGASLDSEDAISYDRDHGCDRAVTHERQADNDEVSIGIVDRPMDSYQHRDLNAKDNTVNRLKVVVVEESGPEDLEASIEESAAWTNEGQSLVIKTTSETILLELVWHVVPVEHVTNDKAIENAKLPGLNDANQRYVLFNFSLFFCQSFLF